MSIAHFEDVGIFHKRFGIDYSGPPRTLPEELAWRVKFLDEELQEYKDAIAAGDLVKQFDALIDLVYVALGNAQLQGLPFDKGWNVVHDANMAKKLASELGVEARGPGDVRKPPGWEPPEEKLNALLRIQAMDW